MATRTSSPTTPPDLEAAEALGRAPRGGGRDGSRPELIAWGLLVAAALVFRLAGLGDRAFHHDESQVAYFSWRLYEGHGYEYNPLLHGPWEYYTTALAYVLGGASDLTARIVPALMGTAMVALPFAVRRQMGRPAALAAGVLLAISPTTLYFSRFLREDVHIAAITLAIVVLTWRLLDAPRRWHPVALLALFAATLTVKESAHIFGVLYVSFALAALLVGAWRPVVLRAVREPGSAAWALGAAAFALVFCGLYSSFGSNLAGIWDGIYEGPSYWLGQHEVRRGNEEWHFYLVVLAAHEWPIVALGLLGSAIALARPTPMRVFLVWVFAGQLALYSFLGEKFAWLALHPLVPLVLLAGIGVEALWRWRRGAVAVVALVGGGALVHATVSVNVEGPVDPRELLVSTQSATATRDVSREIVALDERFRRERDRPASIVVDASQGAAFPYAWYLRERQVSYDQRLGEPDYVPIADVLVLTEKTRRALLPKLGDYDGRRFAFRVWWVRDYSRDSVGAWLDWLVHRRPFSPTGGMTQWVYFRRVA